jgi:hypothetical protein
MTEHQREEDFLAELLDVPEATSPLDVAPARALTRHEERSLLDAANQAGTPTLAPQEYDLDERRADGSFLSEATDFVRRYPIPSLLAGAAAAYLLARRRR